MATKKTFTGNLLKTGAKGFLSKETKKSGVAKAVVALLNDKIYVSEHAGVSKANNPF